MTLPTFRPQIGDPTTWLDAYICTLESAAMGLDFTTAGQVSVWGGQLIPYCGKSAKDIAGASGHPGTSLQNAGSTDGGVGADGTAGKSYTVRIA